GRMPCPSRRGTPPPPRCRPSPAVVSPSLVWGGGWLSAAQMRACPLPPPVSRKNTIPGLTSEGFLRASSAVTKRTGVVPPAPADIGSPFCFVACQARWTLAFFGTRFFELICYAASRTQKNTKHMHQRKL